MGSWRSPDYAVNAGGGAAPPASQHGDGLADFGVPYDHTGDERERRAISWKYQSEIFNSTPRPRHMLQLRFEDFILRQEQDLKQLEGYLGFPVAKIEVRPESVGRWKSDDGVHDFPCFQEELRKYGYAEEPERLRA